MCVCSLRNLEKISPALQLNVFHFDMRLCWHLHTWYLHLTWVTFSLAIHSLSSGLSTNTCAQCWADLEVGGNETLPWGTQLMRWAAAAHKGPWVWTSFCGQWGWRKRENGRYVPQAPEPSGSLPPPTFNELLAKWINWSWLDCSGLNA